MAIWQLGMTLIPEEIVRKVFQSRPISIPTDVAEEFMWWGEIQPPPGFERRIDLILPSGQAWSPSMRVWGSEDANYVHVIYADETQQRTEEIAVRIDVRSPCLDFLSGVCSFARDLGCIFMTSDYQLVAAELDAIEAAIRKSLAQKYLRDPIEALKDLKKTGKTRLE